MQEVLDIPDDANVRHSDGSYTESEFGGGSRSDLFLLLRTARFYVRLVVFFVRQIGQRRMNVQILRTRPGGECIRIVAITIRVICEVVKCLC